MLSVLFSGVVVIYTLFNIGPWKNHNVIRADVAIYYSFLPAVFIYQDLMFTYEHKVNEVYGEAVWVEKPAEGIRVQKCTYGLALLNAPFFLVAHQLATPLGYPADGYAEPYQMALLIAGGVYALLGLLLLRLLLLRFFNDRITAATLLTLLFATNLYYYSTTESPMSHAYGFFLITGFLLAALKWLTIPSLKNTLLVGVVFGLIVLVRPTNGIVALFPLLYGTSADSRRLLLMDWVRYIPQLIIACLCVLCILFPQLLYWKYTTDSWVYFSYSGERFFFDHPHLLEGLFSYRKGWLLYTPVMVFALIGIGFLRTYRPALFLPVLLITVIHVYLIYSWWAWWYGGSYGSRPMVDLYGLLALPLACFYDRIRIQKKWVVGSVVSVVILLLTLNLVQTQQKRLGILHFDSMTKELYWLVFGRLEYPFNHHLYEKRPDYDYARLGKKERIHFNPVGVLHEAQDTYPDSISPFFYGQLAHSPPYSLLLNPENSFSPELKFSASSLVSSDSQFLKVKASAQFYALNEKAILMLVIQFQGGVPETLIRKSVVNRARLAPGWHTITLSADVPYPIQPSQYVSCFLYNTSNSDVLVDDFKAEVVEAEIY
jgi:hypothetical protein